jgi:hypothetical protein
MSSYQVNVIDQTVHRWIEDGRGDYVCAKGGFEIGTYPTLDEAKKAIDEYFGYELQPDDYQDAYISANRIEDEYGYEDPDGDYIVDYFLCIDKIDRVSFKEMGETNDRLLNIVLEVSRRLADEEDYDEYLAPELRALLGFLVDTYQTHPELKTYKVVEESR